jgi:asparagine synthetase B (glutamine-hydrolysing)
MNELLNIPPSIKTMGLYLSGGVESSLLLYLLSTQYVDRDIKACILIKPNRINLNAVSNVLHWTYNYTGKQKFYTTIESGSVIVDIWRYLSHSDVPNCTLISYGNTRIDWLK